MCSSDLDVDGTVLGDYTAGLLVEGSLLVDITAIRTIDDAEISRFLGCLRAGRIDHGLLLNFGAEALQVRKFILRDTGFHPSPAIDPTGTSRGRFDDHAHPHALHP